MYHLDDKDVDRISRNAADNYKAPGEPSWDALRQTLDKEMPQEKEKKRRGFFLFFLLAGLFVAGSLFWFNYQKNIPADISTPRKEASSAVSPGNKTANPTVPAAKEPTVATVAGKKIIDPVRSKANAGTNDQAGLPVQAENKSIAVTAPANTASNYFRNKSFNNNIAPQMLSGHPFTLNNGAATPFQKENKSRKNKTIIAADNTSDMADINRKPATVEKELKDKDDAIASTSTDPITIVESAKNDTDKVTPAKDTVTSTSIREPEKKESVKKGKKKPASKVEKAFNIGITAGIDYTTVRFKYGDNAGYNIGIMTGYQFSKNWSVYTGAVYTKKNYKLNGKDYYPPSSYWTSYVDLQTVEGYCNMWEVPLLARYTFNSKSNTRFFASTGLSSYFMKKQQYNYNYKTVPAGTPGTSSWTNNTDYNHLFSILHFSAGFEKQVGKHLNWQVEPYAKLPLNGLGFGDIKLSSFGINFSIQYRQPVKR